MEYDSERSFNILEWRNEFKICQEKILSEVNNKDYNSLFIDACSKGDTMRVIIFTYELIPNKEYDESVIMDGLKIIIENNYLETLERFFQEPLYLIPSTHNKAIDLGFEFFNEKAILIILSSPKYRFIIHNYIVLRAAHLKFTLVLEKILNDTYCTSQINIEDAIDYAISNRLCPILEVLLRGKYIKSANKHQIIFTFINNDDYQTIDYLMKRKLFDIIKIDIMICLSIEMNKLKILQTIFKNLSLSKGFPPKNNIYFTLAVRYKHVEIIKYLLDDGRITPSILFGDLNEVVKNKEIMNLLKKDERFWKLLNKKSLALVKRF